MTKRQIGIFILCGLTFLPLISSPAGAAERQSEGTIGIHLFAVDEENGALPRIELYDYLAPGNAALTLDYRTRGRNGRLDELSLVNPGDHDHELSYKLTSQAWSLEISEDRIYHKLSSAARTRRETDFISLKHVQPDSFRATLNLTNTRKKGALSSAQPMGQKDREGEIILATPAGSVTAAFAAGGARMVNGADNNDSSKWNGIVAYKPGRPLSAVLSMDGGKIANRLGTTGAPTIRNNALGVDASLRLNGGSTLTAGAGFDDSDASTTDALSVDNTTLALGLHGGNRNNAWKIEYRFVDRTTSGIQTTDQDINRYGFSVRLRPGGRGVRLRAGVRFENRETGSSLQPSLSSFTELGSEKLDSWMNLSLNAFRRGGNATAFIRSKSADFTLAPGVNRGTTGVDTLAFGLSTLYPAGKTALSYSYLYGKTETTFMMDWQTAAGATVLEAGPANDQETHTVGINWAYSPDTDIDLTLLFGVGRSGGLLDAGRSEEKDGVVTVSRRFKSGCSGSLSLRASDYAEELSSVSVSEDNFIVELSMTKPF